MRAVYCYTRAVIWLYQALCQGLTDSMFVVFFVLLQAKSFIRLYDLQ